MEWGGCLTSTITVSEAANTSLPMSIVILVSGMACMPWAITDDKKSSADDVGLEVEQHLIQRSQQLFGIVRPLEASASDADFVPREDAIAAQRVKLAEGLQAEFVARNVASWGDMISFWPTADHPSHLLICIEQIRSGVTPGGHDGLNTSVQRVNLAEGRVETILYGMHRCDGIRTTS